MKNKKSVSVFDKKEDEFDKTVKDIYQELSTKAFDLVGNSSRDSRGRKDSAPNEIYDIIAAKKEATRIALGGKVRPGKYENYKELQERRAAEKVAAREAKIQSRRSQQVFASSRDPTDSSNPLNAADPLERIRSKLVKKKSEVKKKLLKKKTGLYKP
jgi:hypothetical protein